MNALDIEIFRRLRSVPIQVGIAKESWQADWEYTLTLPSGTTFTAMWLGMN